MPASTIEEVELRTDARGSVFEPIDAAHWAGQQNVHVVLTEAGAIRGNHYHEHNTEIAVVLGPALVRIREEGKLKESVVPEGRAYRFTFPPRVSHAFQNCGQHPMLLVAFNTAAFNPACPDVVRDVLIE